MNDIREKYYNWLTAWVGCDGYDVDSYGKLLKTLDSTQFEPSLPMDKNRADDGVYLRYLFAKEFNWDYKDIEEEFYDKECSMLEMMVAIAHRLDSDFLFAPTYGDRTSEWFWMMIYNLNLMMYDDDSYDIRSVHKILRDFCMRRYSFNGSGGLFVIDTGEDATSLDIWSQACRFADGMLLL